MANAYQRGDLLPVVWTAKLPSGGNVQSVLNITGYEWDDMVLALDVTGTIHAGRRARIAGLGDAQGNVTLWFDLDSPPWNPTPLLRPGVLGFLQINVNVTGANPFGLGILVEKFHYTSKVDNALGYNFDWKESVLGGQFFYPAGAFAGQGGVPGANPQGFGTIPGTGTTPPPPASSPPSSPPPSPPPQ